MLSLAQLQAAMRTTIHAQQMVPELDPEIVSDVIPAASRMQIYQNNYQVTLIDTLIGIFPVVSAFVGEVFTRRALKHFVEDFPPTEACLSNYGVGFPNFLDAYEHAADVPYVADLAFLEWTIYFLQHQGEAFEDTEVASNNTKLNENAIFLESKYPLLNLWMVGTGQLMPEAVHLDQGGQHVCVLLQAGEIQLLALSEEEQQTVAKLRANQLPSNETVLQSLKNKNILI